MASGFCDQAWGLQARNTKHSRAAVLGICIANHLLKIHMKKFSDGSETQLDKSRTSHRGFHPTHLEPGNDISVYTACQRKCGFIEEIFGNGRHRRMDEYWNGMASIYTKHPKVPGKGHD